MMSVGEFLERFGKTLFEAPLAAQPAAEVPPELAEIRLAALDRIREKTYRAGGGRKVFPYDLLYVRMSGVEESRRDIFAGKFFRAYLEQEVRNALRDGGCRYPENLRVDVDVSVGLPKPGEQWLTVETGSQESAAAGRIATLVICEGSANTDRLRLEKARTNVGRTVDVYRDQGLFRRNDLAFAEETDINRTVSREHAHIQYDRVTGEYRLFHDRWYQRGEKRPAEGGTWIVRDGMSLEVHRDSRGAKLEPGDEIHFGRAVVMFEVE